LECLEGEAGEAMPVIGDNLGDIERVDVEHAFM
jgi:hypothetical protein